MIKIRENLLCDINVPDRLCNLQSHACLNSLMSLVLYKAASRRPWSRAIMAQDPPSSEMLNTRGKLLALNHLVKLTGKICQTTKPEQN